MLIKLKSLEIQVFYDDVVPYSVVFVSTTYAQHSKIGYFFNHN